MPYVSTAQRGYLHVHEPALAARWDEETPKGADLPEHVSQHAAGAAGGAQGAEPAEVVPGVTIFDEHEELGPDGQPVRRFERGDLEDIAVRCNARDAVQPCPLTIGHTRDNVPEDQQPEIVGYARSFRVAYSAQLGRHILQADFHLYPHRAGYARQFPRVSVELWPNDRVIDPVALLRRTPQRD